MSDISLTPAEKQALYTAQVRVSPVTPRIEAAVVGIIAARLKGLVAESRRPASACTDPACTIPRRAGFPPHGQHDFRAGRPAPPAEAESA